MSALRWLDYVEGWIVARGGCFANDFPKLKRAASYESARTQYLAGASDLVVSRLLDRAMIETAECA